MRRNAIIRIVLFSIALLLLSGILLMGLGFTVYSFDSHHTVHTSSIGSRIPENTDQTFCTANADTIQDIEIDWAAGSITIVPAEQENITVTESSDSDDTYPLVINESGSKLSIEYCEDAARFIGINRDYGEKHLLIYVPKDWECRSLEIDAASAGLDVSDMVIREVDLDGASGICHFTNCQISKLDIDTASGDVVFHGILEELDFDAMSACFRATLSNVPTRLDVDTMSGDLDISIPDNSGFILNLDAMSGDFSTDFATVTEDGAYVCGDRACRINVSAMSGDVAIHKCGSTTTDGIFHNDGHTHNESCYEAGSTCPDYPAFAQPHVHNESCYQSGSTCPNYDTTHHDDTHH